jgi:hypothetical protein
MKRFNKDERKKPRVSKPNILNPREELASDIVTEEYKGVASNKKKCHASFTVILFVYYRRILCQPQ